MLSCAIAQRVYLARGSTDMRKSIDGLAAIVSFQFKLDVFSDCMFVFCNRGRNKLKILYWDTNGFWLYYFERIKTLDPTDPSIVDSLLPWSNAVQAALRMHSPTSTSNTASS